MTRGGNKQTSLVLCLAAISSAFLSYPALAIPGTPMPGAESQAQARVNLEYMTILRKAWAASRNGATADDAAPYEERALDAATAERSRQISLCKATTQDFKTEAAYVACLTAAYRGFAASIKLKDSGATDALAASLSSAATDADDGRLTAGQARDVYDVLTKFYESMFGQLSAIYALQTLVRFDTRYTDRFEATYRAAKPVIAADQPPLDEMAQPRAQEVLGKAREACTNQPEVSKKAYVDCLSTAERQFTQAIKLRDNALYHAIETTLQAMLGDPDMDRLTFPRFVIITAALTELYDAKINGQQSDYHKIVDRPVAMGYAVRFLGGYVLQVGNSMDPAVAPYAGDVWERALRDQNLALRACARERKEGATETANLECWLAGYRNFAATIQVRDTRLVEAFSAAMRQVAIDTDAGQLTSWQEIAVYEAITRAYYRVYINSYDSYLVHQYQPLVATYVTRFDNDIVATGTETRDADGPPWDIDAGIIATRVYDQAINACFGQKSTFKTHVAFWDCRAAADRTLSTANHTRNLTLLEKWLAAVHQAAVDADDGKITAEQLDAAAAGLGMAYDQLRAQAWRVWRARTMAEAPQ